jgi:hypothetical protein
MTQPHRRFARSLARPNPETRRDDETLNKTRKQNRITAMLETKPTMIYMQRGKKKGSLKARMLLADVSQQVVLPREAILVVAALDRARELRSHGTVRDPMASEVFGVDEPLQTGGAFVRPLRAVQMRLQVPSALALVLATQVSVGGCMYVKSHFRLQILGQSSSGHGNPFSRAGCRWPVSRVWPGEEVRSPTRYVRFLQ